MIINSNSVSTQHDAITYVNNKMCLLTSFSNLNTVSSKQSTSVSSNTFLTSVIKTSHCDSKLEYKATKSMSAPNTDKEL